VTADGTALDLEFSRLTAADSTEVVELLTKTWPLLYGETGCIAFDAAYLDWLYGGPNAAKTLIVGCRKAGRLVGVKAAVYRRLSVAGAMRDAQILTHLAIAPDLALGERMAAAGELSRLHSLSGFAGWDGLNRDNLNIAYFEAGKPILRNAERAARKEGYAVTQVPFRQAIVNARRLSNGPAPIPGSELRTMVRADVPAVLSLLSSRSAALSWAPDAETFWHHSTAAPGAHVVVVERDGEICGVMAGYVLGWIKSGATSRNFIVETLAFRKLPDMASLLSEAVSAAKAEATRGVILENVTHLTEAARVAGGILVTPRDMVMSIRTREPLPASVESFDCDVK